MKWLEIGTFYFEEKNCNWRIDLHDDYGKALLHLSKFSHCLIITLLADRLDVIVGKIHDVNTDEGQLTLMTESLKGQLVDIKPYFPIEEVINEAPEQEERFMINYGGKMIGKYKMEGRKPVIRISEQILSSQAVGSTFKQVKSGDILRVLWWFNRFDKDHFRKMRRVNPPYNDAPKTGIFATRSPVRPNPVATTIVRVEGVDHETGTIKVNGFDGFDGSEIFQIMHYQPGSDKVVGGVSMPEWVEHWTDHKSFAGAKKIQVADSNEPYKTMTDEGEEVEICGELELEDSFDDEVNPDTIHIQNANIHNLKNVSTALPKNKITLITGVSGSGKSSLAFDTVYAESQKKFMDLVMSNHMEADALTDSHVDRITGLQPAIAIEQRSLSNNPRSTVGTVTRIAEVMKLLFTAIGERRCPTCHEPVDETNVCTCGTVLFDKSPQMFGYNHPDYMCPVCKGLGVEMRIDEDLIVQHPEKSLLDSASSLWGNLRKHKKKPNANWIRGGVLALADDLDVDLDVPFKDLPDHFRHQLFHGSDGREVSLTYQTSKGRSGVITRPVEGAIHLIERLANDTKSERGLDNVKRFMSRKTCSSCNGERLIESSRLVSIKGMRYPEAMNLSIDHLYRWVHETYPSLSVVEQRVTRNLFAKINFRLKRLQDVGLTYINLNRSLPSLSGGEAQRLKLATQFGTGLSNLTYIMDEPSKGLHPKDYGFLMAAIVELKAYQNTVILVEHKKSFLKIADKHLIMGPKAGQYGGEIVEDLTCDEFMVEAVKLSDLDGFNDLELTDDGKEKTGDNYLVMKGVRTNNLKSISAHLPKKKISGIIGVSGSGKSSLISKTLYPTLLTMTGIGTEERGDLESLIGADSVKDVSYVNQKAIGNNSRSNPATYTGVFDLIRVCYSKLAESKEAGLTKDYFSFNSKKGQCPECSGLGEVAIKMHYMDDINVPCRTCEGKRYKPEVLEIKRKGHSIGDLLDMEIGSVLHLFEDEPDIHEQLIMLDKVGLGYVKLGQSASTLSGGEAQRIKLAKELYKKDCNGTVYILDEPTTGLHEADVEKIIGVIRELNKKGATIIIIEHHLQMIRACDYLVELGPEGGDRGGKLVREGYLSGANK